MRSKSLVIGVAVFCLAMMLAGQVFSRTALNANLSKNQTAGKAQAMVEFAVVAHRVGKIHLGVANNGTLGKQFTPASGSDYFTGDPVPNCEYPKYSNIEYLYAGALWVGAVVGQDTLVSTGADGWQMTREMFPGEPPLPGFIKRSIIDLSDPEFENAISHEDYVTTYWDTLTDGVNPDYFGRPHMPLNIEVRQTSMAWYYPMVEDVVLLEYRIKNIGVAALQDAYIGIYVDADVGWEGGQNAYTDDVCGFLQYHPITAGQCSYMDEINIAWIADNNGDLNDWQQNGIYPARGVTGVVPLQLPGDDIDVNFNWWVSHGISDLDFGPRNRPFTGECPHEFRDFGTGGIGTPEGDANKYYTMSNCEHDYDQIFTAFIQPDDPLWMYPNQTIAQNVSDGYDARYLISFGPFDIAPGQMLPIELAYVAGDYFHLDPNNGNNLPDNPEQWMDGVSFADLVGNAKWAEWVYDNPGIDTDGDGYHGEFIVCPDTVWISGDGVPDFQAASAPPPPVTWLTAADQAIHVRFNGTASENSPDYLSREVDFEGYNVYLANQAGKADFAQVANYDIENYLKYMDRFGQWELRDDPFTLEELRCLYGASCDDLTFNPLDYTESSPYMHPIFPMDSVFYFAAFGHNASVFGVDTDIRKVYPNQLYPSSLDPAQVDPSELTPEGLLKYFEYFVLLEGLQNGATYQVAVTATDHGIVAAGVPPLETPPHASAQTILLELGPVVIPTYEWIDIRCLEPIADGLPLMPGDIISVFDPDGVLCGQDTVEADGHFGFMPVYADDSHSLLDEGAQSGDNLSFAINGMDYMVEPPLVWTAHGDQYEVCSFSSEKCVQFDLDAGWHLISWNVQYSADVATFLTDFVDCVDVVLSFQHGGKAFDPATPQFSTLGAVDYSHGYWLRLECPVSFEVCGNPIDIHQDLTIYPGWNLVSYWPTEVMPTEQATASLGSILDLVYGYDHGLMVYDSNDPVHSDLTAMAPGFGYWLMTSGAGSLNYTGAPVSSGTTDHVASKATAARAASPEFMLLYGSDLSLDGAPLQDGSLIEVVTSGGQVCGSALVAGGVLPFMPVYGFALGQDVSEGYPHPGDKLTLRVNGSTIAHRLTWSGRGSRLQLKNLRTGSDARPGTFRLSQNYPNPFNPTTVIAFELPHNETVTLTIFNVLGQQVATLVDSHLEAGHHEVEWNGTDKQGNPVTSGVYFYRLESESFLQSKKMLLMK